MNIKFHYFVLVTALVSTTAVAICPAGRYMLKQGKNNFYHLCANFYWNTSCGHLAGGPARAHYDYYGLLWSVKPCEQIKGAHYAGLYPKCVITKDPKKHPECFFGHTTKQNIE